MRIKLSLTAMLLFLTTLVFSQEIVFSSGDFDFEVLEYQSNAVRLKALDGTLKGDIIIPDSVTYEGKTYAVTQITNMGNNPNVLSIRIPKTVTSISSLSSLSGLQNVYVDESNSYYKSLDGVLVSSYKMSLNDIPRGRRGEFSVPDGITQINTDFYSGITKLTIPASVTVISSSIGNYVTEFEVAESNAYFSSVNGMLCSKDGKTLIAYPMTNESIVTIPECIDSIGTYAFRQNRKIILNKATPLSIGCSNYYITGILVKSDNLPIYQTSSKTSYYNLFGYDVILDSIIYAKINDGEASLVGSYSQSENIVIPQTITDDKNNTYIISSIGRTAFYQNSNLREVKLPESLKSIGDSAFYYNTKLQEITLPASLTEIGKNAFYYCYNIQNVYALCAPIDISAGCFYNYYTLYVPSEFEEQYRSATEWRNFSTIIAQDFSYGDFVLKKLTDNTLSVIKYIGTQTDITIPDEVTINNTTYKITAIGNSAFESTSLTSIKLPNFLEEIGERAFWSNYDLTSVNFPNSLRTIGNYAFYDCYIATLTFPNSLESIGDYAFSYNYSLRTIVINKQTPFTLGYHPFYTGNGLKIIIMPSSSVDIYKTAEKWQDYRNYIYGVDAIVDDLAYQKLDDKKVVLTCCFKSFSESEYDKLTIPEKVTIDDVTYDVTVIGEGAFYSSYNLNELIIPECIDSIGNRAFNNNTILRLGSLTPPKANNQTFYNYPKRVIVPFAALDSYKNAENWNWLSDYIIAYDLLIDGIAYMIIDESHAAVSGIMSTPENRILEIPEKIKSDNKEYTVSVIDSQVFSGISGYLLALPQSIDSIGSTSTFGNFTLVYLKSTTPPRLGSYNFCNVYIPSTALNSYLDNEQWVSYEYYKRYIHGTDGIIYNDSVIYEINNTTKTAELCAWMKEDTDDIELPNATIINGTSYSVTSLRDDCFRYFNSVKTFRIPNTIINIGNYAIPQSSNMTVIAESLIPPTIGSQYGNYLQRQTLYVASTAYDSYRTADVWKDFGNIVSIDAGDDQFYYAKVGNGKAIVTGLKVTTNTEAEIPESVLIDGEKLVVTQIGEKLYMNNRYIHKVSLPNTIEEIGDKAFFGSSLEQIAIPATVKSIGERAFATNPDNNTYSNLNKIQVRAGNESFTQRDEKLLLSKDGKKLIQIARNGGALSYSWGYDDAGIYSRKEINPLNGIEQIAAGALDGCQTSTIKLPASLPDADATILMYMPYLQSIEVDTLHQKLFSIDGILFSKDTTSVLYFPYYKTRYSDFKNYELPEKVQNIAKFAFYNSQFENLTLSDSLKTIADSAFYSRNNYSNQIGSLILTNDIIATASETAFNNKIYQNTILYVPMGTQNDYLATSPWFNFRNINSSKLAEEDFLLLKAFYEEMGNGEGWYRQWTFGETPDDTRITRGIRMVDDHVYSIDLSSNGLKGGLSDKLFKLPYLTNLNLSNNQLSCPIDSVLNSENIDNSVLRELNVSSNQLTGNIGSVTNTLKNLTTLDVSNNKLTQVTPMLSSRISSLSIYNQKMDTIDYKSLYQAMKEDVEIGTPNLLFYDHYNRSYASDNSFILQNTDDDYWLMILKAKNGKLSASEFSSYYSLYKRPNGDILRLSDNTNSHTVPVRMLFDQGDVNLDTLVNVSDLQLTVNYSVSEKAEHLFNFTAADIQTDDWINVQDVVCLVNLLLNQHIDANSGNGARMRSASVEDADAQLFWRGNQLVLMTDCDIAALDIAIENANDVKWLMNDVDYDFSISKQNGYIRVIHYSMAGKDIKAGEYVIAESIGHNMFILKADLVGKDGRLVKTIINGTGTGIEDFSSENANIRISANITGVNILASLPMKNLEWVVYGLNGNMLGKGISDLSSGLNSLNCNLAGESQVVVRLSNDKINITKKVSIIK